MGHSILSVPFHNSKMFIFVILLYLMIWNPRSVASNEIDTKLEKDIKSLDYISLTGNYKSRKIEHPKEANMTWVIGNASCSNLQPGCHCNNGTSTLFIVCHCSDHYQVVDLRGEGDDDDLNRLQGNIPTSWRFEDCSKVIVQKNFLSAFFETGKDLLVEFKNISSLIIHESAFTLQELGSSSHNTTILFDNCHMKNIPPKAFPSYLSTIKFVNCTIGTLSSSFIQMLRLDKIIFESSSVDDIDREAFYRNTIIDSFIAKDSRFKRIHGDAFASAIQYLTWSDSLIDRISKHGINGPIATVVIERCVINYIDTQGFSVKSWTMISLENNTFEKVKHHGIDLAHLETQSNSARPAVISGNTWKNVEKDFIITGVSEEPFATVKNNTFLTICSCEFTFTSFLTLNGSRAWLLDELFQSSRCLMDEKGKLCLNSANNSEPGFIAYEDLELLCSPEVFMCASEVQDVPLTSHFPNRLVIAAVLIGAFALFMIVSLLLTMLVYTIRRKSPAKTDMNGTEPPQDLPQKEFMRSINCDQYAAIHSRMPKTPSMPTRLGIFEDVEMEDKGVQTMPTELSADIIEGLREKLTKPDSFWDAKETINHLYDLIHVREQSAAISSPPDVTVRNDTCEIPASSNANISHDSLKPLISPTRRLPKIVSSDRLPRRSVSSFAQIPSPTKSAQICDYRDPSDSKIHIYSELVPGLNLKESSSPSKLNPLRTQPTLCEYTEPRDYQTHIYAELSNILQPTLENNRSPTKTSHTQTANLNLTPLTDPANDFSAPSMQIPMLSSVIPSSPLHKPSINDLNTESPPINFSTFPGNVPRVNSTTTDPSTKSAGSSSSEHTTASQMQRPLPSIPFPSISTVQ